ncbi:S8 family serine peptidase [Aquimarina sp. ERC-38]|uniref:S8 family peptidase n=1 Tax=Aquimarina sp. ERC-38 TaxID=2949996 RepID=UPI002246CE94|nr:S8 family serine peptidase [Aquimarina sp. ERC-38]UZO79510.1 S8 family serine peptidase [Aquimarina sp. ERC-38]
MKNLKRITACSLLAGLVFTSCQDEKVENDVVESLVSPVEIEGEIIEGSYIIMLDNKIKPTSELLSNKSFTSRDAKSKASRDIAVETVKQIKSTLSISDFDQTKVSNYYTSQFTGVSVEDISQEELVALSKNPAVASIHYDQIVPNPMDDVIVEEAETKSGFSTKMAQRVPCGINRAGGFVNSAGAKSWIWIIDTGIDLDHPDLNVITDRRYARSFVGSSPDDCNGHGTHVAGSAAAKNNGFGVVGVSAGAPVVPVRVFGCRGGASSSAILAAINHVGANDLPGDVVNMSLGGFIGSRCAATSPYRSALIRMGNNNTRIALAAGNSSRNASNDSPACINGNNIFTVASMTCNFDFSGFSNFGRPTVDVIATGSSVLSTWPGGRYNTISGTSMASPHVAGILHARKGAPLSGGNLRNRGQNYPVAVVRR